MARVSRHGEGVKIFCTHAMHDLQLENFCKLEIGNKSLIRKLRLVYHHLFFE